MHAGFWVSRLTCHNIIKRELRRERIGSDKEWRGVGHQGQGAGAAAVPAGSGTSGWHGTSLVSCGTVWKGAVAVVNMMAQSSEGREAAERGGRKGGASG